MKRFALGLLAMGLMFAGCSTSPKTEEAMATMESDVAEVRAQFIERDKGIEKLFKESPGYAIFPSVGKGAVGVGGAYGRGAVYERGDLIGYTSLSQGSIGFQLGGQEYSEVIFFEDQAALDRFKEGNLEFAAQASAVAATAGASADAKFDNGVMVFTMTQGGLMYEASIGGQKFDFEPAE